MSSPSSTQPPPAIKREGTWDVESIFNPPKHQFESPSRPNDDEQSVFNKRKSPPRFLGKKRSAPELSSEAASYRKQHEVKLEEKAAAAAAAAAAVAASFSSSAPPVDEPDAFPIKFSLSHDYKDDGSFSEYLKDNSFGIGPSPRGSPVYGRAGSFGMDAFDFENNSGSGFPLPKLQFSPMSTPPPVPKQKLSSEDLAHANLKLDSPPLLKSKLSNGGARKMTPPRFPVELIHGYKSAAGPNDPVSTLSPRFPEGTNPYSYSHVTSSQSDGGPTQHQSPGQTIYNVASKSVGSPPSPYYQQYPWRHHQLASAHPHHPSNVSTPIVQGGMPHDVIGLEQTSPEFNPPRSHLRGTPRSGSSQTITVGARNTEGSGDGKDTAKTSDTRQFDPITPSPHHHPIRQAVSDESSSPHLPPTVHQPPVRPPGPPTSGGWPDSLQMAPLPPYAAHQTANGHPQAAPWGSQQHQHGPPAMPSAGSAPGYHPYYSPYYQQQQQQAVPDHASSNSNNAMEDSANASEAADWRKHHHLLHQFLLQFGHCNVPQGYGIGTHYEGLHAWCNEQRAQYQRMNRPIVGDRGRSEPCTMTPTRVRILTSMGFMWGHRPNFRHNGASSFSSAPPLHNSSNADGNNSSGANKPYSSWNKWMELLAEYRDGHGNVDVPLKYESNPSLGTFVNRQRTEHRKLQSGKPSSMTPERVEDLNRLGFTWAIRESHTSWEERFVELKEFRDQNSHCNVPKIYGKNPSLGYWVNEQRFQYRRLLKKKPSYMTQEKIDTLNALDFKWSLRETNGSWDNWLKELREYREQHGDIDVPLKYKHNQALGAFVNRQRTEYRKLQQGLQTSLTSERIQSLDNLGFKWAIRVSRTPWDTRLGELQKFKEQHGHCNVPSTYPKNQPLAYWVFKQRGQYRIYEKRDYVVPGEKKQMCHMTPDRIAKLDEIGFEWNPPRRIK